MSSARVEGVLRISTLGFFGGVKEEMSSARVEGVLRISTLGLGD